MNIPATMRAARMHEVGGPLILEELETPKPGPYDVLVRVKACGIVPNLANILAKWSTWYPQYPLPKLPAIFGLDPAGEIVAVGEHVFGYEVGQRVYVNPGRGCGTCDACITNDQVSCKYYTFNGYFGHTSLSWKIFERYPYAGFGEYMTAPVSALVKIPDSMSYEGAARLGYIGTAYAGLKKGKTKVSSTVLINGASGTLGLSGVLCALAMGVRRILGTGRDRELLAAVKALAPDRIDIFSTLDGSITDWVEATTHGDGADVVLDCLGPGSPPEIFLEGLYSLARSGILVDVGAVQGELPIKLHYLTTANRALLGSNWFSTEEGRELAVLAETGALDMSVFEHQGFPLEDINEAISGLSARKGGFTNFVIYP
ncbi:alcohol dehydrogenase catalytic domain-containing protein [Sphingobium sp.]|uniref:alcohol dehydrogenase catalytic domain-containing protein n=1 Tax=Sphingobium sp. TaxID=1912891 RepID=UPI0028BD7501|nr:alcohol dehydrogenase catalytic domain-containing protein [Sphingobium sp.]